MPVNDISKFDHEIKLFLILAKSNYSFIFFGVQSSMVRSSKRKTLHYANTLKYSEKISGHKNKIKIDDSCLEDKKDWRSFWNQLYELRNIYISEISFLRNKVWKAKESLGKRRR